VLHGESLKVLRDKERNPFSKQTSKLCEKKKFNLSEENKLPRKL
jgi:hypothetical protein